ncbi:MAG TPA: metal ABC transporter permease [Solirubrobacteraceae bacterium]|jgi:zinc/manganese transport system permease protein|nr:metal ABC transporter permease [Solirubrobacteraceae bacterium]
MSADVAAGPHLGWNLVHDVSQVVEYHFMVNALLAGAVVAVMAGVVGWVMVLRREAFAGHTLSMMAFPGAAAATLIGVASAWGYFAFCGAGALAIGGLAGSGRRSWSEESASIGSFQALALAAGFLFVSLYGGVLGDLENLLFGNLLGISDAQVLTLGAIALASIALLGALARPLLFASVDPDVAAARGVPVRALAIAFLAVLGLAVAATSQITGPLLVFALLVMPAASAQVITARPALGLVLSVVLALAVTWLGLAISYFSVYPAGFFIATISFCVYLLARIGAALVRRGREEQPDLQPLPQGVIA